jgi:hypothetical protein
MSRICIAVLMVIVLIASFAMANPYDRDYSSWAKDGAESAIAEKTIIGDENGRIGWQEPCTTERVLHISRAECHMVAEACNNYTDQKIAELSSAGTSNTPPPPAGTGTEAPPAGTGTTPPAAGAGTTPPPPTDPTATGPGKPEEKPEKWEQNAAQSSMIPVPDGGTIDALGRNIVPLS